MHLINFMWGPLIGLPLGLILAFTGKKDAKKVAIGGERKGSKPVPPKPKDNGQ